MKVLFDHASPFLLAHGGLQIQIEETKRALEALGEEVEYLRWWDVSQEGDLIHFFGRPAGAYLDFAHAKGLPVVISDLLTGLGSRSSAQVTAQATMTRFVRRALPYSLWARMGWDVFAKADRVIALTGYEADLMRRVFEAPPERVTVVPNGVAQEYLTSVATPRGRYLVCTATITERKRVLETSLAAVEAKTPLWVIGKPYADSDTYARKFLALAQEHPDLIRYEGPRTERAELARAYREARGFVLLSTQESLSLSALEAAACGCTLLLGDLPWARTVFGNAAEYCPITSLPETARRLREFYDAAPTLPATYRPLSWIDVAEMLKKIYVDVRARRA